MWQTGQSYKIFTYNIQIWWYIDKKERGDEIIYKSIFENLSRFFGWITHWILCDEFSYGFMSDNWNFPYTFKLYKFNVNMFDIYISKIEENSGKFPGKLK